MRRVASAYLLFAHEPYWPGPGAREIDTIVVAADTLLPPRFLQPGGTPIHALLTQGRQRTRSSRWPPSPTN